MNDSPPVAGRDARELARAAATEIAERAGDADRARRLPAEDIAALKRSGLLGLSAAPEYGGWGASLATCVTAQLELARGSAATALVAAMTLHILGHQREAQGWPEQVYAPLSRAVVAGALINSAASEPALGSPARGGLPESSARREGDRLILDGRKTWVTGGAHLDHLLVQVALEGSALPVWVPADTPGVRWEPTWGEGLSLRASDSDDLFLDGVSVPAEHQAGSPDRPRTANVWFPMLAAATYLGPALAARDAVIAYALERTPTALGRPIATLPSIQRQIGELDVDLQAARTLLVATAELWRGEESERGAYLPRVAAAKHLAVETALSVTDRALRIAGAAGLSPALPLERYFRDVRAGLMHPPSGDAALESVGRAALGL
jgi:alkylation response protein AidB-like acyl-CoA dehydrogenase